MKARPSTIIVLTALTVSLAAEAPSDATTQPRSGCDLATAAELGAIVGSAVKPGETSGLRGCQWSAANGLRIRLGVFGGDAATCKAQQLLVSGRQERVPDLGDTALWGSSGDLVVCSAKAVITIDLEKSRNDPRKDRDALIAIARLVLGKVIREAAWPVGLPERRLD
jgi:hypothetical protein